MSDRGGEFFFGFVVGALAGAAAALLLTPYSGDELRDRIEERGIELKDQAEKLAVEAKTRAEDLAEEAKGRAKEIATDAVKQAETIEQRGRVILSDTVKKAQQAVEDLETKVGRTGEAA